MKKRKHLNKGAATLIIAVVFIMLSTLIIIFAARNGVMQSKISANTSRNLQAYEAAEAGLEFGINYLDDNTALVIANPLSGMINFSNSNTTNVPLNNGSKFTVVFTNPTANDYTLIQITSTGVSDDNSSTRVVSQLVKRKSILVTTGTYGMTARDDIIASGNATFTNMSGNANISAGDDVYLLGNAATYTLLGQQSSAYVRRSDISSNNSAIGNLSSDNFFAGYFGTTSSTLIRTLSNYTYSNSVNTNYGTILNGITGGSIWIDATNGSTASLSGNTVIGSSSNPVLIVVNGRFSMLGNATIYGMVFVRGDVSLTTLSGSNNIYGTIISTDDVDISGNSYITYSSTVLTNLRNTSTLYYWAKVPGSWKDY